jgi:hypothetical protein
MTTSDKYGGYLNELVFKKRSPRPTMTGPQEGTIITVTGTGAGTTCMVQISSVQSAGGYACGPAPCPAGAEVGQRALVVFVGSGVGDPWVLAVTTVPAPPGF